ncbi:MAG: hypothetical protein PHI49_04535 [Halothiobacillaceae bacterium]|jgi:hypothetical protein|nr:hypothetical protein [Halothiobacillaceae bacterium]
MEPELMQYLARFKLMARRKLNMPVDIHRMMLDKVYAEETLKTAEDADDEDLLMLALEVATRIGLLPDVPDSARREAKKPERYVFGPRG